MNMEMTHTNGQLKLNTPAYKINAEHAALMNACGLPSYEQLLAINADLVAALEAIASCDGLTPQNFEVKS